MSTARSFRVVGGEVVEPTNQPAEAIRSIAGHDHLIRLWSPDLWARTPEHLRPVLAQPIGDEGWIDVQPIPAGPRAGH